MTNARQQLDTLMLGLDYMEFACCVRGADYIETSSEGRFYT